MAALGPVALIGLVLAVLAIAVAYWKEFRVEERVEIEHPRVRVNRVLMWKSILVSLGMIGFFFLGLAGPQGRAGGRGLAMSSTLADNLTLLGWVANLIVVHRARHEVSIGFWEYC